MSFHGVPWDSMGFPDFPNLSSPSIHFSTHLSPLSHTHTLLSHHLLCLPHVFPDTILTELCAFLLEIMLKLLNSISVCDNVYSQARIYHKMKDIFINSWYECLQEKDLGSPWLKRYSPPSQTKHHCLVSLTKPYHSASASPEDLPNDTELGQDVGDDHNDPEEQVFAMTISTMNLWTTNAFSRFPSMDLHHILWWLHL